MPEPATSPIPPVIVDLGKVKPKRIKQLKQGRGKLTLEVDQVVDTVRRELGDELEGKEILPVVILYRSPPKKKRFFNWL